jgi:hypothetical protein
MAIQNPNAAIHWGVGVTDTWPGRIDAAGRIGQVVQKNS